MPMLANDLSAFKAAVKSAIHKCDRVSSFKPSPGFKHFLVNGARNPPTHKQKRLQSAERVEIF